MFWQSQAQQLSELELDLGYYRQSIVISYFPPTGYFGIRKDVNSRGLAQDSIVVLELVLPTSKKLYRWNRSGMVEAITSGRLRQRSSYGYPRLGTDFPANFGRYESGDRSQTTKLANLTLVLQFGFFFCLVRINNIVKVVIDRTAYPFRLRDALLIG
jgi:hypothetical protein